MMNKCKVAVLTRLLGVWLVIAVLTMAFSAEAAKGKITLRRFALIAGANDGGTDRVQLMYAHSDAQAIDRVLRQLGGVLREDRILLLDSTRESLVQAFDNMEQKLASERHQGVRVELVFYYSGHSDEKGLLMSGELFTYKEIRARLDTMPADVRIAILDSCASGSLTRSKGGKWRAPFLVDESAQVRGHAFLTSASADEAAQESDRVKGSFFTHYMVSGLRGAADLSSDNRVTLNEAYQYAFNETLARTESTQAGPQHPSYDFQLTGAGDLVLTDLSKTSALMILPAELEGRLFVRDQKGRLIAEINKPGGRPVSFGLEPGDYSVTVDAYNEMRKGVVALDKGSRKKLVLSDLEIVAVEVAVARGDSPGITAEASPETDFRVVPFNAMVVPGVAISSPFSGKPEVNNLQFSVIGYGHYLDGFEASAAGTFRKYDVSGAQVAGGGNFVAGNLDGFQGAAGANFVGGNSDGAQLSAGANVVAGKMNGYQGAAVVNYATDMDGAQTAIVNVAGRSANGFQGGLVNWGGHMRGTQLGLINVAASMRGAPIGIFNFIGDGLLEPGIWSSDTAWINYGLKMGSRSFYSILGGSVQPGEKASPALKDSKAKYFGFLFGMGTHVDWRYLWLDVDLITHSLHRDNNFSGNMDMLTKLRATLGLRLFGALSIYAGPTLNFHASKTKNNVGFNAVIWQDYSRDLYMDIRPGLAVGMQIEPHWGRLNSHD
jgi:hypothetical protein